MENLSERIPKGPDNNKKQLSETGAPLEEFNFYQRRFEGMAERHNKRRGIERFVDRKLLENDKANRPRKINKMYVMKEQAYRENADLKRRLDPERREWDEKLKPVIEALKLKRDDAEGEGKKHKVLIYGLGGGLRSPYGAGQVIALNEMGITADKVDVLAGASGGMADVTYYAGGPETTYKGASAYYDETNTPEFLDVTRISHIMDSRVMGRVMRYGEKSLNQQAIIDSPAELWAIVTRKKGDHKTAELINAKTATPDLVAAVEASINVPLLRAPGIKVNDVEYIDGSFDPLPLQQLIDKFHPTDILVLPNVPFRKMAEFKRSGSLVEYLPNSGSPGTIRKFLKVATELRNMLEDFKEKDGVNIGVLWPPDTGLDTLDSDPDLIQYGIAESARDAIRQFGEKQPEKINLYIPAKHRRIIESDS